MTGSSKPSKARTNERSAGTSSGQAESSNGHRPPQAGPRKEAVRPRITTKEGSSQMRKAPTRVLVAATSLVVVAASVLAVTASAQSGARANHQTRPFHLTKECPPSTMQGEIGDYCTVTSSNVPAIRVGTKIFYAQAAGLTSLDSDVILYVGPWQNRDRSLRTRFCDRRRAVHAVGRNQDARRHPCSCRRLVPGRDRLGLGRDVPVQRRRLEASDSGARDVPRDAKEPRRRGSFFVA